MTREEWLNSMTEHLRNYFFENAYDIPDNVRISCGLPSVRSFNAQNMAIGQCWDSSSSSDNHYEIFISPTIDDSIHVAATLAHELAHATVGLDKKHGPEFRSCAIAVGLTGRMTATTAGKRLKEVLEDKIIELGEYPHAQLDHTKRKKQPTRMIKIVCLNKECEYSIAEGRPYAIRMSRTTMDYGMPICGCCNEMMRLS